MSCIIHGSPRYYYQATNFLPVKNPVPPNVQIPVFQKSMTGSVVCSGKSGAKLRIIILTSTMGLCFFWCGYAFMISAFFMTSWDMYSEYECYSELRNVILTSAFRRETLIRSLPLYLGLRSK